MRDVEILGMEMAREHGVCSLNAFRQFVGLRRELSICCNLTIFLTSFIFYGSSV